MASMHTPFQIENAHRFMSSDRPFTPEELLDYWQKTWLPLSKVQQQKFLSKSETHLLCEYPRVYVTRFIKVEKKLDRILDRVSRQWLEAQKKLSVAGANLEGGKIWCSDCSCNHLPDEHNDRESYL